MATFIMPPYFMDICCCFLIISTISVYFVVFKTIPTNDDQINDYIDKDLDDCENIHLDLENHMTKLESMINTLEVYAYKRSYKVNYTLYKSQIENLENDYTKLYEQLLNVNTNDYVDNLTSRSCQLRDSLHTIKKKLDEKIVESCIEVIYNNDFKTADDLFYEIEDVNKIYYIVNKTYSSQNFYKILNVSNYITNSSFNFYLIDALNKEINMNSPMNVTELVALADTLSRNVINAPSLDSEILFKAKGLMHRLTYDITPLMVSYFDNCSKGEDLYQDCNAKLLSKIYSFDSELVFDIFTQLYFNHTGIAIERIIQLFLIDNLSDAKTLFDLLEFTYRVFERIGKDEDHNTDIIDFLKDKPIPEIIRTILFVEKVGLFSKGAKGNCFECSEDPILKNVRPPRDNYNFSCDHLVLEKAFSCFCPYYEKFLLRSIIFKDYYLGVDDYDNIVLTEEMFYFHWIIEVVDESYIKIKPRKNQKYLYMPSNFSETYTRDYDPELKEAFLWRISDCSIVYDVPM